MTIEKDYLPDRNLCSEWTLSSFCKYSTFFLLVIATLTICDWFQEIIYGGVLFHRLRQWYFLLDFLNFIEKILCRIATIRSCSFLVVNFLEEYLNAKIVWKYHCANVPWELQKLFQYLSFLTWRAVSEVWMAASVLLLTREQCWIWNIKNGAFTKISRSRDSIRLM